MQSAATRGTETTTIMEFLAESPHVDVSRAWERCWNIQAKIGNRVHSWLGNRKVSILDINATVFLSQQTRRSGQPSRPSITSSASWVIATTR